MYVEVLFDDTSLFSKEESDCPSNHFLCSVFILLEAMFFFLEIVLLIHPYYLIANVKEILFNLEHFLSRKN